MKSFKPQTVEAIKEFLRTLILGLLPSLAAALGVIAIGIDTQAGTFHIKWAVVLAVLAVDAIAVIKTSLMSAADRWLHENKVEYPLDLRSLDKLSADKPK